MATKQLALGLVLRFADQGSGAARTALDGVGRALDGVRQRGTTAADAASRMWGKLRDGASASRAASAAADAAAASLDKIGSSKAAEGADRIKAGAQAATQALDKMRQAAEQAAKAGPARDASGRFLPRGAAGRQDDGGPTTAPSAGVRATGALANAGRGVAGVAAGYVAGRAVVAPQIAQTMSYDRRLAHLANTGAPDGSVAERQALMREMDSKVMDAVRAGGGSRESALDTLDKLVASGAYKSPQDAMRDLPTLVKFGSASGADAGELADIAVKARQSFGITDFSGALDKAMRAGQLGGFELKDMAKWLPQQMAAAKGAGLSGEKGLEVLLAANQAAVVTAGSKDEAGNNLVNLLAKINSSDTAVDAKKLGIDLTGSLAAARAKGVNSLDAFVNMVEQVSAKDPRFVALQKKASQATGDEQRAMYADMAGILKGSAIGKLVQDRQALMALVGVMQQRYVTDGDNTDAMRTKISDAKGTGDRAQALIETTASFKTEMLAAEKANAMQQALNNVNPLLGKMADWLSGVARDYPTFTTVTVGATTALAALAAAAGAASLAQALGGGAGGAGAGALAARAAGAFKAPVSLSAGLGLGGTLGLGAAGATGYALGTILYDQVIAGTKAGDVIGESIAKIAAFFGSQEAAQAVSANQQAEAARALKDAADSLKNSRPSVYLDNDSLGRSIDEYNNFQARRK